MYDIDWSTGQDHRIVFQRYTLDFYVLSHGIEDNPSTRARLLNVKLPKNVKLGVDAEYINGWKSFDNNK